MNAIRVRAPSRLHFGMFSFGQPACAQFGGVGVMIEPPSVEVTISPADRFIVRGSMAQRARQTMKTLQARWSLPELPALQIEIQSPPNHVGLGVGTQLSLALAAGLRKYLRLAEMYVDELATSVGRSSRSAVGTHGFAHGGMIVDAGKGPGQLVGTLARRVALPRSWRFVLVRNLHSVGLAGTTEANEFATLPPVPKEVTRQLWTITTEKMLPAADRADCESFGEAVYQFGALAGGCFFAAQGGAFASREIAATVELIRELGVPGTGQSSWGPTVFAITAGERQATELTEWLRSQGYGSDYEILVARPNNSGARIEEL